MDFFPIGQADTGRLIRSSRDEDISWGILRERTLKIGGRPALDTVEIPLERGFSLVAHAGSEPLPVDRLAFIRHGTMLPYADAIAAGRIGSGFFGFDHASGSYVAAESLRSWQSYWITVLEEDVTLRVVNLLATTLARTRRSGASGWTMRFIIESSGRVDSLLTVGTCGTASELRCSVRYAGPSGPAWWISMVGNDRSSGVGEPGLSHPAAAEAAEQREAWHDLEPGLGAVHRAAGRLRAARPRSEPSGAR